MSNCLDLSGRVAIVTGASRGIGRTIAETLAAHGATLVLNSRQESEIIAQLSMELTEKFNIPVSYVLGDISQPQTSANLVKDAFTRYKRLDIYVNNAGVLIDSLIGMASEQDINSTLGVNLAGVVHGVQAAARLMQRNGSGSIINMSSIIGRFGNKGQLVYSASKAGVIGATLAAAKELAPKNIRVNAIAPGFIDTDMVQQIPEAKYAERMASIGMGRIGKPQDIANAALFLASDLSTYVTGQVLGVDGGMLV